MLFNNDNPTIEPHTHSLFKACEFLLTGFINSLLNGFISVSVTVLDTSKPSSDLTKTLPEAITLLQSKYDVLEYKVAALAVELKEEREARIVIQNILKDQLTAGRKKELDSGHWHALESNI